MFSFKRDRDLRTRNRFLNTLLLNADQDYARLIERFNKIRELNTELKDRLLVSERHCEQWAQRCFELSLDKGHDAEVLAKLDELRAALIDNLNSISRT